MAVDIEELRSLSPAEKLRLIELLWDDLGESDQQIPLPEWIGTVARKRREDMLCAPSANLSRDEMWKRVENRRG